MQIYGLNKTTLLDYPGHIAATIFTGSCNFRCPFCQNGELVLCPETQPLLLEEEIFDFLKKRKGILQGVCITGGEPTLQADLLNFIRKVREIGYLIKLDTNGYRPEVLDHLIDEKLLDFIAMDIKSCKENYSQAAGIDVDIQKIEHSVESVRNSGIPYEFRTTVVKNLHSLDTFEKIGKWLKGSRAYYLQQFQDSETVLCKSMSSCSKEEMLEFVDVLKNSIDNVEIRGLD